MGSDDTYTITNVRNNDLKKAIAILNIARRLILEDPGYLTRKNFRRKTDGLSNSCIDPEILFLCDAYGLDRTFPLETVEIQSYNLKHEKDITCAIVHTGPYANEVALSLRAFAVTIANDIYFKDNKFNTETEEGRALLAHELTHVSQADGAGLAERGDFEYEAEQAEIIESCEWQDYHRESKQKRIIGETVQKLMEHVEMRRMVLRKEEYAHFLRNLKDYLDHLPSIRNPKTAEERLRQDIELRFKEQFIW